MQEQNYSIKEWAKYDRPREKLLMHGPDHLSDSELIAILLHHGTRDKTAVDLAKEILLLGKEQSYQLGKLTVRELMKIKGSAKQKQLQLPLPWKLGDDGKPEATSRNLLLRPAVILPTISRRLLKDHNREVFAVAFLNQSNRINHVEIVSEGGITGTIADPRIILEKSLGGECCWPHPLSQPPFG